MPINLKILQFVGQRAERDVDDDRLADVAAMEVGIREGEGLPGAERQLDRIKDRRLARVPRSNEAV